MDEALLFCFLINIFHTRDYSRVIYKLKNILLEKK